MIRARPPGDVVAGEVHGLVGDDGIFGSDDDGWGDDVLCGGSGGSLSVYQELRGEEGDDMVWGTDATGLNQYNNVYGDGGVNECDDMSFGRDACVPVKLINMPAVCK